jgi:hypothetical protein
MIVIEGMDSVFPVRPAWLRIFLSPDSSVVEVEDELYYKSQSHRGDP